MHYYACLNTDDICVSIQAVESPITDNYYIEIPTNDQTIVGQHYDRTFEQFEPVYYYAQLNADNVVESVSFSLTQQTTSETFLAITFEQYQTVTGMFWNGSEFTSLPIHLQAVASTDEVNFKGEDKWLSAKLDEMDSATAENAEDIAAVATDVSALETALDGKADTSHLHGTFDINGLDEALGAVSSQVSGKANANHNHDGTYAAADHTHSEYLTDEDVVGFATTAAMNAGLSGKSDASHNHDTAYAGISHTHGMNSVTGLADALAGKADASHTHEGYAASDHTHTGYAATGHTHTEYANANHEHSGYAESDHTHDGYAASDHSHTEYASASHTHTGYAPATHTHTEYAAASHTHAGYAASTHTHSDYASTATVEGIAEDVEALETAVNGKAAASHTHTQADVSGLADALSGKADATHTHSQYATSAALAAMQTTVNGKASASHTHALSGVTGLEAALDGKSDSDHTHTPASIGAAASNHTHNTNVIVEQASSPYVRMKLASGLAESRLYKNASASADYGLTLADYDAEGAKDSLIFCRANTLENKLYLNVQNDDNTRSLYYLYGEHHKPTPDEIGAMSASGGTVNGNLNVAGILRVNSQQCIYDSGSMITLSTNNRQTMIAGSTIYSKVAISVSSDERLKEGIQNAPVNALAAMVDNIKLREFSYLGSDEKNVGVIAQELIASNPKLEQYFVRTDADGYYSVKTADLVYPLIAAVQALGKRVAELEKKLGE